MFSEAIEILMVKKKLKKKDIADVLGCSVSNVYSKFRKGNFSEQDLMKIAEAYSCSVRVQFFNNNTDTPI